MIKETTKLKKLSSNYSKPTYYKYQPTYDKNNKYRGTKMVDISFQEAMELALKQKQLISLVDKDRKDR